MALRIAREEIYLPLPMGVGHVVSMYGKKTYLVPVEETRVPEWILVNLKDIGQKAAVRGLVIVDNCNINDLGRQIFEDGFNVVYSVWCGLTIRSGVTYLRFEHIIAVDFDLCWKDGKCYQKGSFNSFAIGNMTDKQKLYIDGKIKKLSLRHRINTVKLSQMNLLLQVLSIPKSECETKVKIFANDLVHALGLIRDYDEMDVGMVNRYCYLDIDEEQGCYLLVFDASRIFDCLKDSLEIH